MSVQILQADARSIPLTDHSVQCVVTSPPYWGGLRDYGHPGQLGLERQPEDYVAALVEIGRELRRVLKPRGTFWLNIGDSFAASGKGGGGNRGHRACWSTVKERKGFRMPPPGFKMKDLTLTPFAVADALRRDGWYLRSVIVWRKPAAVEPMRRDRPAQSHEYLFLLAPSEHYDASNPGEKWWGHTVWDISQDARAIHPAAMPTELARRCVLAGSTPGDVVLDPFAGSGTTGLVAQQQGRNAILLELNPEYMGIARGRINPSEAKAA